MANLELSIEGGFLNQKTEAGLARLQQWPAPAPGWVGVARQRRGGAMAASAEAIDTTVVCFRQCNDEFEGADPNKGRLA